MKLRKLFALLMTAVMLLGMMPMAHAELTGCNHDWDGGKWINGAPANCQEWKPKTYTCTICGETWTGEECGPCQPGSKTWVIPQASNCQEYGVWEITCKHCGEWLDGTQFSIDFTFADGTAVHAGGYGCFPENYGDASRAIDAHFLQLLPEDMREW